MKPVIKKGGKFKTASNNSVMELRGLLLRVDSLINKDYRHVCEYLSEQFLSNLQNCINAVEKEIEIRENNGDM